MAYANKIQVLKKTIGWNVYLSHPEADGIGTGLMQLPLILAGVVGPKALAVLQGLPTTSFRTVCALGGHKGVKAIVMFYPPHAVLLPRAL